MELKPETLSLLSQLGDESKIDDGLFRQIVQGSLFSILKNPTPEQLKPLADVKHVISGLVYLFLESAKLNAQSLELSTMLEEAIPNGDRVKYICQQYENSKGQIRNQILENAVSSSAGRKVVDLDWRLDYVVKTGDLAKTNEPIYTIKLYCDNGEKITLTCNTEELQDLYSKIRDATTQVKRLLK